MSLGQLDAVLNAGVVYQHVEGRKFGGGPAHQFRALGGIGYVAHAGVQAGVLLPGFGQFFGAPAADDDVAAGLQEPDGQGQSDARSAAGKQHGVVERFIRGWDF